MIIPSDKEYILTKRIKKGNSTMNSDFVSLAEWIDNEYEVRTLNILYDTIDGGKTPRLEIIFEYNSDKEKFNDSRHLGFDKEKQASIGRAFERIIKNQIQSDGKGLRDKYMTQNVWVIYSAFEPIAKIEANGNIPQDKIADLKYKLRNKDIWEISKAFYLHGKMFFISPVLRH